MLTGLRFPLRVVAAALLAGLPLSAAGAAPAKSPGEKPPAPPTAQPAPQVHYHFHYHAPPSWAYPGYYSPFVPGGPMTSFPLWQNYVPPTAAEPYPPWYVAGPFTPLPFPNPSRQAAPDKAVIDVFLPVANAVVYLNGQKMRGTGKTRRLTTALLPLGRAYQYYVTVTYKRGGRTATKYRKLDLVAGDYAVADFTRPPLDNPIKLPSGPVDANEVAP
jgi:uncharacterized protein (TIGR03000 family)